MPPIPWSLGITAIVVTCTIGIAGVWWRSWLSLVAAPLIFSLLTAATLLVELDVSSVSLSAHWTDDVFWRTSSLFARSAAAICSIAFLASTTPVMDLLAPLQRIAILREIVDLAAMIFRFLMVALKTLGEMRTAQSWRMGDGGWHAEMRAASLLASALFIRCVERAKRQEVGLTSRGYTGQLHLLRCSRKPSLGVMGAVLILQALLLSASIVNEGGVWRLR
jgi:cobalt/nickel transport system permease protein